MRNARFSQYFHRWMNRVRGPKKPASYKPRSWPKLGMELFEERVVPSVVPAPTVDSRSTITSGFDPSVAIDPTDPNRMLMASTDGVNLTVQFSSNGGISWRQIFISAPTAVAGAAGNPPPQERIYNPNFNPNPLVNTNVARAFTNAWNPSLAFARPDALGNKYVYLSHIETDNTAGKTSGVLVVHKFDMTTGVPVLVDLAPGDANTASKGKVLYQWANQDPILNPTIAVNNNVADYTDPGLDNTPLTSDFGEQQYLDSMSGAAVYVAWNTNATAQQLPFPAGLTFNANRILVKASSDGGFNFTNAMDVDDAGYLVDPAGFPNYGHAAPQITFSPGNSQTPGQLIFAFSGTRGGTLSTEASSPNGGVVGDPAAGSQTFIFGPRGSFLDALPGTTPPPSILSEVPVTDPLAPGISLRVIFNVPVVVNTFTSIDIFNIFDATAGANVSGPFTVFGVDTAGNQVVGANTTDRFIIRFAGIVANHTYNTNLDLGNITGTGASTADFARATYFPQVILPGNITDPLTNVTDLNVSLALSNTNLDQLQVELLYFAGNTSISNFSNTTPTRSVVLLQNRFNELGNTLAGNGVSTTAPFDGLPGCSTLNKDFLGIYDFNSAGNSSLGNRTIVGTIFDEQAPRDINDPANLRPYIGSYRPELGTAANFPATSNSLQSFNGFTAADLVGTWVIKITDYRFDGPQANSPPFRPTQFLENWSLDVTSHIDNNGFGADTPITNAVTNTSGIDGIHPTKPTAASTAGVGSGQSIAVDNTLGSFSPFAGRMYMAFNGVGGNDVFLIYSDDNGATWSFNPLTAGKVNDDSFNDNFSEGTRQQFQPSVTVDPLTGSVVVTWYDARNDAANLRVTTYMAVSIDGGDTFSKQVALNTQYQAYDTLAPLNPINLEPIPTNFSGVGATGFANNQAVVAIGGKAITFWSGNDNGGALSIKSAISHYAAGPRIIFGDSGPVVNDARNPLNTRTYNNTFASDGTRQLTGFTVTFDRPVAVSSFDLNDVGVYFLAPDGNPITSGIIGTGTPVAVLDPIPQDLDFDIIGSATEFFIPFVTPQSQVGTYSYTIGGVRDAIRNSDPAASTSVSAGNSTPVNTTGTFLNSVAISTINHPGLPAGQTVDNVSVTLSLQQNRIFPAQIVLFSPSRTAYTLYNRQPLSAVGTITTHLYDQILLDDSALGSIATLTTTLSPVTGPNKATYTGAALPDGAANGLSTLFDGETARGGWQLVLFNGGILSTDTASILNWSLTLTGSAGTPDLTELALGNPMDQDADGIYAETDNDVFSNPGSTSGTPLGLPFDDSTLPLIIPGPYVTAQSQTSFVSTNASSIVLTFDRDMNQSTFTAADVFRLNTPIGMLTSGFTINWIDNRNVRVSFPTQIAGGAYSLEIGPDIQSASGFSMDTNHNAGLDRIRGGNPLNAPLRFNDYSTAISPVVIQPRSTVSMPLAITDNFRIYQNNLNQIQIRLNITYAQPSELVAFLVSPLGTRIRLFTNPGPTNSTIGNFSNTLLTDFGITPIQSGLPQFDDGPYTPQFKLSDLIGEGSNGTWSLEITNTGSGTGSIDNFTLRLPFAESGTGLGENPGDKTTAGFRIYNLNPTDEVSRDVWTPLGPTQAELGATTHRVGRVTAVAVDPSDPTGNTVYVGGASGGVWKTTNFLTTDTNGPAWIALTDFGSVGTLAIGSITVLARNNDPLQSIILATTGSAAGSTPNVPFGNAPGIGMIRSTDGGRTWRVFDSTVNVDSAGNVLPIASPLRDHLFVGSTAFRLVADPQVDAFGKNILYMAVSGSAAQRGVWRSNDGGGSWTRILIGNASDITLAPASQGVDGNLQIIYASVTGVGVYLASNAPTAAAATVGSPNGSFFQLNGGTGNPLIRNASLPGLPAVPVLNPGVSPTGAAGFIKLAVPALTNDPLKDDAYIGWVYALTTRGLYMTKDFGANWTLLQIPNLSLTGITTPINGTNNENRVDADSVGLWTGFGYDIFVDPSNANIVYLGGETMIKVDATAVKDPHNFTTRDFSDAALNLSGGAQNGTGVLYYDAFTGLYLPTGKEYLNLQRDPLDPFNSPSQIQITGNAPLITSYVNNGANVKWQPVSGFLDGSRGIQDLIAVLDPVTRKTRLVYGTEGGIYSVLDDTSGGIASGSGDVASNIGFYTLPETNRNGSLQITQYISGAVQTSQFAADLAGAMFYGMTPIVDTGSGVSSPDATTNGDIGYLNYTGPGTWVSVDPSGTGNAYQYVGISPIEFFTFLANGSDQSAGGVSRTNGLFTPGGATGGTAQWQQLSLAPGFLSLNPLFGQAAINTRDPKALILGSQSGRIYRTTDGGLNWFQVAAPTDVGSSYAMALAFGAPNSNAAAGPITGTNNFLYAGNQVGRIYITLSGGAPWKVSAPLTLPNGTVDNSPVQKIIASPISGKFDAYAITSRGVYYLADARAATPTWQNISGNLFSLTRSVFGVATDTAQAITELTSLAVDWRGIGAIPNDSNTASPAALYVGGDGGVFRTKNAGASGGTVWSSFPDTLNDGSPSDGGYLPRVRVTDLDLSLGDIDVNTGQPKKNGSGLNMLVATTYGRGQFAIRLDNSLPTNAFVSGPRVNTATDVGSNTLRVVFNSAVLDTSFDATDVRLISNVGNVSLGVVSVTPVPHIVGGVDQRDTFDVVFNAPVTLGQYTLTIGKDITDLAGNPMNQNNNTTNGEAGDAYRQQVIVGTSPTFTVLARIAGTTFVDLNADGVFQVGETLVSGRNVFLDLDNNGVLNGNEPSRVTDSLGRYDFGNFTAGNYTIKEVLYGSNTLTNGNIAAGNITVALQSGQDQAAVNLGHRFNSSVIPIRVSQNLFTNTYANGNTAYVNNLFRALFNRTPTLAELNHGLNALNSGVSRTIYADVLYKTDEYLGFQVDTFYQKYLGRAADAGGRAFWIGQLRNGISTEWISIQFLNTAEYFTKNGGTNDGFVRGVYRDILGRDPSNADVAGWVNALTNPNPALRLSRFDVAFRIVTSGESYATATQSLYVQLLHRTASAGEISGWVGSYGRSTLKDTVIIFLASSEFYTRSLNATG